MRPAHRLLALAALLLASAPFALAHPAGSPEPSDAAASGWSYLSPASVIVNTKQTLEYHYVVGSGGMVAGDSIRIEDPLFHGMTWAKYGQLVTDPALCTPQTSEQDSSTGMITAHTSTGVTVTLKRSEDAPIGLNTYAYTDVTLDGTSLAPGDEIVVVYGDATRGWDCGFEFSDRSWHKVGIQSWETFDGGVTYTQLDTTPTFDVTSLSTVKTLRVTGPSQAIFEDGADLQVAVLDELGNPIESWTGTISVNHTYGGAEQTLTTNDAGVGHLHVTLSAVGDVDRITVAGDDGSTGTSNPIVVYSSAAPPTEYTYWGDLHTHHGHSYTTDDGRYLDENIVYARDVVGLDFATEAQKTLPIEIDGDALWLERQDNCVGESEDGKFISMLGFEWMGDHITGDNQGHNNFYFDSCNAPLGALLSADYPDGIGAFASGQGPYDFATGLLSSSIHTVIIPHAPLYTGYLYTGEAINNTIRTAAEVYSEWGFNMTPANRAGSIPDGLRNGNRFGFVSSSDNHDGWLGNPFSNKSVRSGLAAIDAPALTRADLFAGLQQRSTYATTGERIVVDYSVTDGAEVKMGQYYVAAAPTFNWTVHGTERVSSVTLYAVQLAPTAAVETLQTWAPNAEDASGTFAYTWDGQPRAVWLDVVQTADSVTGDNDEAWASPIWLTGDCTTGEAIDPALRCPGDSDNDTAPADTQGDTQVNVDSVPPVDSGGKETGVDSGGPHGRCNCGTTGGDSGFGLVVMVAGVILGRRRRV